MIHFTPRAYQQEAIDKALDFLNDKSDKTNAIEILPTGSGKSVVIANIAMGLGNRKTLILQPSKEILEQNYKKYTSYGYRAGIYSASIGQKYVDNTTFATIGSIINKSHLFRDFNDILVDECHLVNSADGMYKNFFASKPNAKVLGLTATPYRLTSGPDGAELQFITRTHPRIFDSVLYYIQNEVLFNAGHLAKLDYYSIDMVDRSMLRMNASGTDFTESSLRAYYKNINFTAKIINTARQLLQKRRNLLVFCSLISEAQDVCRGIPGSVVLTGDTESGLRASILNKFKNGTIKCVINVGVLTTGFDYPELECVLMARSTMSLALYYQIVGRGMRPHADKESCWIVDLGGNVKFFGKIETMLIKTNDKGQHYIVNNGRQLTNTPFSKN